MYIDPRYERNIPALTKEECALLREKRVLVVGCGGLGGHLIELMARIGIGSIRAVDADRFVPSNLNRQTFSDVSLLGMGKAKAAAARVSRINPEVAVEAVETFLNESNVHALLRGCDAVLDGLDNIQSRRLLSTACAEEGIPYIYGAVDGWIAQAAVSMPADRVVETLYPENAPEKSGGSVLSFTPALCAAMQASLCVKLLAGRPVKSGTVFCFDLLNQEFEAIPILPGRAGDLPLDNCAL